MHLTAKETQTERTPVQLTENSVDYCMQSKALALFQSQTEGKLTVVARTIQDRMCDLAVLSCSCAVSRMLPDVVSSCRCCLLDHRVIYTALNSAATQLVL